MPEKTTQRKVAKAKREGKSASTQASAFVEEEMRHLHEGKTNAQSPQQAIAIGLSKARRSGVELAPPAKEKATPETRKKAAQDLTKGRGVKSKSTTKRSSTHQL
jgi:hypothetical protein